MRAVDELAVGRERQIACPAAREEALCLLPRLHVDHGNVAAQSVGDVERVARPVDDDASGFESGGQRPRHFQRRRVDDRHRIVGGIGHVDVRAVRR